MTDEVPGDLETVLLGGERRYTAQQVADAAGVPRERTRLLWLALGFPEVDDDEVIFTDADVEAAGMVYALIDRFGIDPTLDRALARQLGQAFSRLAIWQVDMITKIASDVGASTPGGLATMLDELLPAMERVQQIVWRRHLVGAAGKLLARPDEDLARRTLVVGFADVVGYTKMTRRVDEDELADFVERFEATAMEVVAASGGRIVKTVGDEVLFVVRSVSSAAEIALGLVDANRTEPDFPQLRAGLARGSVLSRFGDVYGAVVNIAARLTSIARPSTVLVDDELAEALRAESGYQVRPIRSTAVRGYRHLHAWRLTRSDG